MSKVLIVVIAIIVIVAIVMVVNQFKGVKFGSIGSLFRVNYNVPSGLTRGSTQISYSTGGGTTTQVLPKPGSTPPAGFTAAQLSPYYGEVKIGNVQAASSWNQIAQFSLSASYSGLRNPIDVTGWRLVYNSGQVTIPTAVADYDPAAISYVGDVTLNSGGVVNVWSGPSPIGQNIRLNECTGFLNRTYSFNPSLSEDCPALYERSQITALSGQCQSFILSLGGCASPTPSQINQYSAEAECSDILNRLNYAGCYRTYRFTSGFFSNEWRIWLQESINFDPSHDRLLLLDNNGLLADEYIY